MGSTKDSIKINICDLCEECLYQVMKYLDYKDLRELYDVHERFHSSIEHVVAKKSFTFKISDYDNGFHSKELEEITKFLSMFGGQLNQLKIDLPAHYEYDHFKIASSMSANIELLIERFCVNGNIKHFTFANFELSDDFIEDNTSFFNSLESIEMDVRQIDSDDCCEMMPMLQMAKSIRIRARNNQDINEFLKNVNLNQVEVLELNGLNIEKSGSSGTEFDDFVNLQMAISEHFGFEKIKFDMEIDKLPVSPAVKQLALPGCGYDPALLISKFPNLEHLEYGQEDFKFSLVPLLSLPMLKSLSLLYGQNSKEHVFAIVVELANRNTLEKLKFTEITPLLAEKTKRNGHENEKENIFVKNLQKLTNLKALSLNTTSNLGYRLEAIARSLKDLRSFEFDCSFIKRCGEREKRKLLQEILKFIKKANKLMVLKLTLVLDDTEMRVSFNKISEVRRKQKNQQILNVFLIADAEYKYAEDINDETHFGKYVRMFRIFVPGCE